MDARAILEKAAQARAEAVAEANRAYAAIERLVSSPEGHTALEYALSLLQPEGNENGSAPTSQRSTLPTTWPGLRNVIRLAAQVTTDSLSVESVQRFIAQHYSDRRLRYINRAISDQLRKMVAETGELKVAHKGVGNKPSLYKVLKLREISLESEEPDEMTEKTQVAGP
jgi:hypothetical protein